jgi:hypothetical protein
LLISGHSTECRQMAGCSVPSAVVRRDDECCYLLFADS